MNARNYSKEYAFSMEQFIQLVFLYLVSTSNFFNWTGYEKAQGLLILIQHDFLISTMTSLAVTDLMEKAPKDTGVMSMSKHSLGADKTFDVLWHFFYRHYHSFLEKKTWMALANELKVFLDPYDCSSRGDKSCIQLYNWCPSSGRL